MKYNLINENFTSNYAVNLMRSRGIADLEQYKAPGREFLSSPSNLKNISAARVLRSGRIRTAATSSPWTFSPVRQSA